MKATVYSTKVCPFCVQAKKLLTVKGISFDEIKVKEEISKEDFQAEILEKTGKEVHTVPQVFLDDQYIGGFNDLVEHFANLHDQEMEGKLPDVKV